MSVVHIFLSFSHNVHFFFAYFIYYDFVQNFRVFSLERYTFLNIQFLNTHLMLIEGPVRSFNLFIIMSRMARKRSEIYDLELLIKC